MAKKDKHEDGRDIWETVTMSDRPGDYALPAALAVVAGAGGRRLYNKTASGQHLKVNKKLHRVLRNTATGSAAGLGYIAGSGANNLVTGRDTLPGFRKKRK